MNVKNGKGGIMVGVKKDQRCVLTEDGRARGAIA